MVRLQRIGKRGQAYFRVAVTEHTTRPKGKYLELLGSYDPHKNELKVDGERIKYWLTKGAKLSETVNNLLVGRKIIEGEKVKVWKPKSKPSSRVQAEGKKKEEKTAPVAKIEEPAIPTPEGKEEKTEVEAVAQPEKKEELAKEESAEKEKEETIQQKTESAGLTANQ